MTDQSAEGIIDDMLNDLRGNASNGEPPPAMHHHTYVNSNSNPSANHSFPHVNHQGVQQGYGEASQPDENYLQQQQQQSFSQTNTDPPGLAPPSSSNQYHQSGHSHPVNLHQGTYMPQHHTGNSWESNNMHQNTSYAMNPPMEQIMTNHLSSQPLSNLQQVTPIDQLDNQTNGQTHDDNNNNDNNNDNFSPVPFRSAPQQQELSSNLSSSNAIPHEQKSHHQQHQYNQQPENTFNKQEEQVPSHPDSSQSSRKRPAESQVIDLLDSDDDNDAGDDNAEGSQAAANVASDTAAMEFVKRQKQQALEAYQRRAVNMPEWMESQRKQPALPPATIVPGSSLGIPQRDSSTTSSMQQSIQNLAYRNTPSAFEPIYVQLGDDFTPTWDKFLPMEPPKPYGVVTAKRFQLSLLNCHDFTIEGLPVSWSSPPTPVAGLRVPIKRMSREYGNATYDRENNRWRIPLGAYQAFVGYLKSDPNTYVEEISKTQLEMASLERARQEKGYPSVDVVAKAGVPLGLAKALAPFQRGGVDFIVHKDGRGLIADDMGLGKTIQGIGAMSVYMDEWPVLVLSPSSARYHWESEFQRFLGVDSQVNIDADTPEHQLLKKSQIHVLSNSKTDVLPRKDIKVVICSYGLAPALISSRMIEPGMFKCAIVDESHMLKNSKTKRTKSLTPILKAANRCVLLSGTPALARPVELWPQLNILDIARYEWRDDESSFVDKYVKRGSPRTRAELHAMLTGTIMIRRLKNDILKSMKPKIRQKTELHVISEGNQQEFKRLLALLRQGKGQLAKLAQKDRGVTAQEANSQEDVGPVPTVQSGDDPNQRRAVLSRLYGLTGDVKIPWIADMLNRWLDDPTKGKLCVFAHHINVLDQLAKLANLSDQPRGDRRYIRIDGKTSPRARQDQINTFQNDASVRIALLGITAAGVAVTLTASSTVWFTELFWTPAIMIQAEDRCHRIGQQGQVKCNYFVGKGTLDDVLWRLIEQKFRNLGEFVEGKEKEKLVIDKVFKSAKEYQSIFESKDSLAEENDEDIDEKDEEANALELEQNNLENEIALFASEEQNELKNLDSDDDENEADPTPPSAISDFHGNGSVKKEGASQDTVILLSDDEDEEKPAAPGSPEFNIFKSPLKGCRVFHVAFPGNPLHLDIEVINTRLVVVALRPERVRLFGANSKPNVGDVMIKINNQELLPIKDRRQFLMAQQYIRDTLNKMTRVPIHFAEHPAIKEYVLKKLEKDEAARAAARSAEPEVIELD